MGSVAVNITSGNEYKLPRGGREAIRLSAQHYMLTQRQGWLLHPEIANAIKDIPTPRIADVATGTGIWALELAQQMPYAEITGLDISDKQFCPPWTVPSIVAFDLYDLLEEVPSYLQGQFDVVHVRLLLAAGPAVDKSIFINRFRSLLRPGGWLQWDELSFPNMVACFPSDELAGEVKTVSLKDHPLIQVSRKYIALDERLGWVDHFEEVMAGAGGFDKVNKQITRILPHLLRTETDLCVAVKTDIIDMLIKNKGIQDPLILIELQKALAALHADVERGVLFTYPWQVCTARKL